ncbi:hypothetical protein GCM10009715_40470 [Paeniglutamicibacter psychrophenolicus]|uniref:Site-specific integrase n=1 Tax=Paeniglutamicibacter psychrophenolicus TaxID=257454 RepID=A0ABS4W8B7_9MICC|nr:hypothetical protein [Paeniglutamicibacter psychrophenolicus]MBP2372433.1 hypothetical protein [Paeniglutamicibacter psychrophenolicus]
MEPTAATADPRSAARGVLADPVGFIVDMVAALESGLDRETILSVVAGVAGGRPKARRLARALSQRPELLTDGRSPAPRALGDLLISLGEAGAVRISAPVCTECRKPLKALQRKGENWYCGGCGPTPEPCTGCGNLRLVASRTRDGGARCMGCPIRNEPDPVGVVVQVVAAIDPGIGAETVRSAILAAAPQPGQRRRLAWALEDHPGLLTGDGAQAPVPTVLRLIELLCQSGAERIVRPPCPHCGRLLALIQPRNGLRLCRNCVAKSRRQPCAQCPAIAEPASRNEQGQPLCSHCSSNPADHETCHRCGRRRQVSTRTADGPVCKSCHPHKILTCSVCQATGPARISQTTGKPRCLACSASRDGGAVQRRLQEVLGDGHGNIRPGLHNLYQELAATERIVTVTSWLNKSGAPTILGTLDSRTPLTHQVLDDLAGETTLAGDKTTEHLRALLVATKTLPVRDEQIARLERWITHRLAEQSDPAQRQLIHRYAIWHQLRRLRGRLRGADATYGQIRVIEQNTKGATRFLHWLTGRGLTLETAGQGDLEAWYISKDATLRAPTGNFIRWANAHKLTSLHFRAEQWGGPTTPLDTEERWADARRLLHDTTLKPEDRVAGLLVILYAQRPSSISRMGLDDVHIETEQVLLHLGPEPILLPEPLGILIRQVIADRQNHTMIGTREASPWLFPGGRPGQAITPAHLGVRLKKIGIQPGQARSTALFQLAIDLPAALMARMLGIHVGVAVQWQRASSGDWASYAADVSRRNQP